MVAVQPEHSASGHPTSALTPVACGQADGLGSPAQCAEDIGRELHDLLDGTGLVPIKQLAREDRRRMLAAVTTITSRAKLLTTRLVAAEAASGDWKADGDKNMEAWLGQHMGSGYGAAKSDLEMAQTLEDLPALGEALEAGNVTVEHVKTTSRQYSNGSDAQKEELSSPAGQARLIEQAQGEDAGKFGKRLNSRLAAIDAEKLERDHASAHARRYLKLSNRYGGVQIDGFLDDVNAEFLRTALDAASVRPSVEDDRSSGIRRADALIAIAQQTLNAGKHQKGGQVRPHVMVTLSAAEWADWQRHNHLPSHAPAASIGDGIPLPPSGIDRLLCDCTIMRAVLDPAGQPVDLGRNNRTFPTHLRKALLLRDVHCTWPGCTMPGQYTEAHHTDEWALGGQTDLDKAILLCSYHHHYVHAHGIVITPILDGFQFTHPDGHLIGEHHFQRHDPPPAWAVGDDPAEDNSAHGGPGGGDESAHREKSAPVGDPQGSHGENSARNGPGTHKPEPPPQLPLE